MDMADQPTQPDRRGLIGWIIAHPKSTLALSILLMFALAILGLSHTAESRLNAKIAAIKAKGEPTTIQDLLARQRKIPDDQNRVVAILNLGAKFKSVKPTEEQVRNLPIDGTAHQPQTGVRWPEIQIQTAEWYLAQIEVDLRDLHIALKIPDSCYNIQWVSPAWGMSFMDQSHKRATAKALAIETMTHAMRQNKSRVDDCIVDSLGMLGVSDGGETLIDLLTQMGTNALLMDTVERTVNQVPLSDQSLRQIIATFESRYEDSLNLRRALQSERVHFIDSLSFARKNPSQPGFRQPTPGSQWFTPYTAWAYVPGLSALDIAQGLDFFTDMVDAVVLPDFNSIQRSDAVEARCATMPWYSIMSKAASIGSYSFAVELWVRNIGTARALVVALAAERYRLAHHQWPTNANALVPEFLKSVPGDPIDGKPIRYAIIPEGIKTWTIADNAGNRDNGGDVQRIETGANKHRPTDYGWVILNPNLRGRQELPLSPTTQSAAPKKDANAPRNERS